MPAHWTYDNFHAGSDLMQGDILQLTQPLTDIFTSVHPHFADPKYSGFVVVSQSCDLVRRKGGRCKIPYITLGALRPLDQVLQKLLTYVCHQLASSVFDRDDKAEARKFLERLFNQNEQSLGLFYLHPDADAGIAVPTVAFLRVCVTLLATHYDVLLEARRGRLCPEFQSKVGWLVGNLYSRVGTRDWHRGELDSQVKRLLDDKELVLWTLASAVQDARNAGEQIDDLDTRSLEKLLESYQPPSFREVAIKQVESVICEVLPSASDVDVRRIRNRLANDQTFAAAVRSGK